MDEDCVCVIRSSNAAGEEEQSPLPWDSVRMDPPARPSPSTAAPALDEDCVCVLNSLDQVVAEEEEHSPPPPWDSTKMDSLARPSPSNAALAVDEDCDQRSVEEEEQSPPPPWDSTKTDSPARPSPSNAAPTLEDSRVSLPSAFTSKEDEPLNRTGLQSPAWWMQLGDKPIISGSWVAGSPGERGRHPSAARAGSTSARPLPSRKAPTLIKDTRTKPLRRSLPTDGTATRNGTDGAGSIGHSVATQSLSPNRVVERGKPSPVASTRTASPRRSLPLRHAPTLNGSGGSSARPNSAAEEERSPPHSGPRTTTKPPPRDEGWGSPSDSFSPNSTTDEDGRSPPAGRAQVKPRRSLPLRRAPAPNGDGSQPVESTLPDGATDDAVGEESAQRLANSTREETDVDAAEDAGAAPGANSPGSATGKEEQSPPRERAGTKTKAMPLPRGPASGPHAAASTGAITLHPRGTAEEDASLLRDKSSTRRSLPSGPASALRGNDNIGRLLASPDSRHPNSAAASEEERSPLHLNRTRTLRYSDGEGEASPGSDRLPRLARPRPVTPLPTLPRVRAISTATQTEFVPKLQGACSMPDLRKPRRKSPRRPTVPVVDEFTGRSKLQVGMRVLYNGELATIRFIGYTDFANGKWLGIEFKNAVGKHDGTVDGRRYFKGQADHGIMVRPKKVFYHGISCNRLLG